MSRTQQLLGALYDGINRLQWGNKRGFSLYYFKTLMHSVVKCIVFFAVLDVVCPFHVVNIYKGAAIILRLYFAGTKSVKLYLCKNTRMH